MFYTMLWRMVIRHAESCFGRVTFVNSHMSFAKEQVLDLLKAKDFYGCPGLTWRCKMDIAIS